MVMMIRSLQSWFSRSSPNASHHHSPHIVAPHPIQLPRRRLNRFVQCWYQPRIWVSGGDTRSSVKCGLGPGLTVAAVARRCGGRWDSVAFRCCGDRGVGDSIHYGRCSGLEGYISVTIYRTCEGAKAYQAMELVEHGDPRHIWGYFWMLNDSRTRYAD